MFLIRQMCESLILVILDPFFYCFKQIGWTNEQRFDIISTMILEIANQIY